MVNVVFECKELILLGDCNIDLQKSNSQRTHNLDTYNLHQLIKLPTRATQNSATFIDHIYVSETRHAIETCVPISNISDHYPVCVTWSRKGVKIPKIGYKVIRYCCFTSFNEQLFLPDLLSSPLSTVYNKTDPEDALNFWIDSFVSIYNKHAPYKRMSEVFSKTKMVFERIARGNLLKRLQWQVCHAKKKKKKKKKKKGKADLTTLLHIRVASLAYEISCLVLFSNYKQ